MASRTWRWLRVRIEGLLSADSRLARHFTPDEVDEGATINR